ncbi:MAG: DUF3256 family protein [Dysgonamonadaceae bacterium]|jgi:hypothetical protein|nr:DUF3256 family protein [Dysgonamonadaceae bacterium]
MNKLNILFLLIACRFALTAQAQTTKEAFIALPESLSVDLNAYSRMDLIDLYHAGLPATVKNSFGDTLTLEVLTPEYLRLHTGKGSLQLILLTMINDSPLYCLIRTVCSPVCDSRMEFYSPSWNRLQTETFITPAPPSFFIEENPAFPCPDISLMQWTYDPETAVLQQIYTALDYLNPDDRQTVQPLVKTAAKQYSWTGMRFDSLGNP